MTCSRMRARPANSSKALAHETRLVILCMLIEGEKSVGEIEQKLDLRQPFVSQQFARLSADDLVETRREGKNVYYSIARPEVVEIIGSLYRAFCARCLATLAPEGRRAPMRLRVIDFGYVPALTSQAVYHGLADRPRRQ